MFYVVMRSYLLVGKQLGITAACWATVKMGLAELPKGVSWIQLYGVTWLAGIGFTMSIFPLRIACMMLISLKLGGKG